ncbi:MAG: putative Xaa-Pro dipeptidase [Promethearchaeota archaeon]|nr:MAG: putative Xaa-Pro dipeptidase [Candidatus Lokiarchaeota archaeon]
MSVEILKKVKSHDKFDEIDALLVTKHESIIYLLGFRIESDTTILIPSPIAQEVSQKSKVFLSALEYDQVKERIESTPKFAEEFELIRHPQGQEHFIEKEIKDLNLSTLGFEDAYVNVKKYKTWKEKYNKIEFIGASEILDDSRVLKTEQEIERMKKAAELGIKGFEAIYESIEEGRSEKELAAIAEFEMRKAGADGTSFDTIVASGKRSAYPHAKTSDKKVEKGDIIIVDIGAKYNGYCSDMTRTFIFEPDNSDKENNKKELVNLVNEGQKCGLEHIKAGKKGSEMDSIVRKFFEEENQEWGSRFIHSLGHGVGIDIHENPYLSPISDETLREGMCVTVEPGLYIPGLGGARTEDLIVIRENGFQSLTETEKFYY